MAINTVPFLCKRRLRFYLSQYRSIMMKSLSFFLLTLSAMVGASAPEYSVHHYSAPGTTNEAASSNIHSDAGAELECRCGTAQFLTLPHANITRPSEAKRCAQYSKFQLQSK
jgi:hypothetical protein